MTLEQRGEEEVVVAYDWATGRTLWTHGYAGHYHTTIAGEGPRSIPLLPRIESIVWARSGH